jgi:oxygen-independent coproporphyrinogen-3 oxidase
MDEGKDNSTIIKHLIDDYCLGKEKACLLSDIAIRQRKFIPTIDNPSKNTVSIYVGIPFCPSKCLYCSFPSYVLPDDRKQIDIFLEALTRDIEDMADFIDRHALLVQNVYIGGGTPTSLKGNDFSWLINKVKDAFITDFTREYTVEAGRPDSIDDEQIDIMTRNNVTRVSVNPQTMQQKTLKHIGRKHTIQDIIDVFYKIRRAGIPIINMDVIAGLPGETTQDMKSTMEQLSLLNPDNLTVHTLAIKKGSVLKDHFAEYHLPNAVETRNMLHIAADYAEKLQMKPYYLYRQKYMTGNMENIGFSKKDKECLYNMQIIEERQTILGMGPAAATKAVNTLNWHLDSFYNPKDLQTYIKHLERYLVGRRKILSELFSNGKED